MEQVVLFETPLVIDTIADAAQLNAELKDRIRARSKSNPGVRKSNWLGWQSDTDMLEWGGSAAQVLRDHFLTLCDRFTVPAPGSQPSFLWFVDMWANVSGKGASNEAHMHPGAVWSAVYYVDDGYSDGDEEDIGGNLVLYDPRMPAPRTLPFDLRYRRSDGRAYESFYPVRPRTGQLVMFPPWLLHSVHPYHGDRDRLSIAMNVTAIADRGIG